MWLWFVPLIFELAACIKECTHQATYYINPNGLPLNYTSIADAVVRSRIECGMQCLGRDLCVGAIFTNGNRSSCHLLSAFLQDTTPSDDKAFLTVDPGLSYREFGPVMPLNFDPGPLANIFFAVPIDVSGTLIAIRFYAARAGIFYLEGWRAGSTTNEIVWQIKVICAEPGLNFQTVTRIEVMTADILGISYDRYATRGVVYYEHDRHPLSNINQIDRRLQNVCIIDRRAHNPTFDLNDCGNVTKSVALELIIL